ncbi:hypothetical protein Ahy_A10g050661 [Arachis hypogaea]|uniref:Uncharacterized protein n=1 Tax=Arachis hypogaea TaxID=3818 RepID=A0A445B9Z9_ARAHY|nr:hypothetical protein Ahy_A10g050661 [Arachis hypogaea]
MELVLTNSWIARNEPDKDKIYNDCVKVKISSVVELNRFFHLTITYNLNFLLQEIFYFDKDSIESIKSTILKSIGRSWKEIRNRLDHECYKSTKTLEQNIEELPPEIDKEHWRWFFEYRSKPETQCINEFMAPRFMKKLGPLEKIIEIEQRDVSSKMLFKDDSFVQALGKEHSGRVRGVDFGTMPSQLFHPSSHLSVDRAQTEDTQRMLFELQAEVAAKKLKRKQQKRLCFRLSNSTCALCYLIQRQGRELPLDIDARMNSLEG